MSAFLRSLNKWANENFPLPSKEVAELTSAEKMALCIGAGVPCEETPEGGVKTSVMCGIIKENGTYRVIQESELPPAPRGQQIIFKVKK